jgi:membrane protein
VIRRLPRLAWHLARDTVTGFFADDALSRGAAISYYTVFSLAPVLLIAIAVAGLFFGYQAAQGAIVQQLSGLMGQEGATALQNLLQGARHRGSGLLATGIGIVTLAITATGVFAELQTSLNSIWKAAPPRSITVAMVRARLLSLGLIAALGFLLLVSLAASAVLQAAGAWLAAYASGLHEAIRLINGAISFALITVLFAAIYKVLPDRAIGWGDVMIGAVVTALLFIAGKYLIGLYIGSSAVASSYGSAGSLLVLLLWIYYSVQIFLLGAEFTKTYAGLRRSGRPPPVERGAREVQPH